MSSTAVWDWWKPRVDWETPAGRLLRQFFATLPADRRFRFTLYGSAPLQLTLDRAWLSADVGLFSDDDEDLTEIVRRAGLAKEQGAFYLEPGFSLSFRTSARWRVRATTVALEQVSVSIPHPLDILIGKLDRLEPKDLDAFRMVIRLTNHPTAEEFKNELQNAVDLLRPAFDEESPNRYPENTLRLWREPWNMEIDLRTEMIQPALARRRQGYGEPPPAYKRVLGE
jgi:hypothetical protein